MKTKLLAALLSLSLIISLCSCFPTAEKNYSTNKTIKEKVTVDKLSNQPKHIKETPFKNFTIDADVDINIKNNFNIYTAKIFDYDFELWSSLFINGEDVKSSIEEQGFWNKVSNDGSLATKELYGNAAGVYKYISGESHKKYFQMFYDYGDSNANSAINYQRDTLFAKKELSFMSSEEAVNLVDKKMKKLGVNNISEYQVFSVDYDYIKKISEEEKQSYEENGNADDSAVYTKEDEFYFIIPKIILPNESQLAEIKYELPQEQTVLTGSVSSGAVFATVGKTGIIDFEFSGNYDIIDENTEVKEIVSLNDALTKVKDGYKDVEIQNPLKINNIELSYVPYLIDEKKGDFILKPTWEFFVTTVYNDGFSRCHVLLIDAVTGNEILQEK